ncbi:MAG: carbohydrate kinase family protein [Melioribacteraceae bacterium]
MVKNEYDNLVSFTDTSVCVMGGTNSEKILELLKEELILGTKIPVTSSCGIGGGGLNYTARLISVKRKVFPIIAVGDDKEGIEIRNNLLSLSQKFDLGAEVDKYIANDGFLCEGYKTPRSTIVNERKNQRRTILKEKTNEHVLVDFFFQRLRSLDIHKFGALIIGHLPFFEGSAEFISEAFDKFSNKSVVFINFGHTQLAHGFSFWEPVLERADILQFNLTEAFQFFFPSVKYKPEIEVLIERLKSIPATCVITLGKLGAIVSTRLSEQIIFIKPFPELNVKDYTGAGDAFGSGLVHGLCGKTKFSNENLKNSLLLARLFAAYACTTLGGASNCPSNRELKDFYALDKEFIPIEKLATIDFMKSINYDLVH